MGSGARRHQKSPRTGWTRKKPDKRARIARNKERDGRRRAAAEAVEKERRRLEERLAREAEHPVEGKVAGAEWVEKHPVEEKVVPISIIPRQRRRRRPLPVPADATGNGSYTLGQARSMLRAGYHIIHVMKRTGWGLDAFDDMQVDADGYGLPIELYRESD